MDLVGLFSVVLEIAFAALFLAAIIRMVFSKRGREAARGLERLNDMFLGRKR